MNYCGADYCKDCDRRTECGGCEKCKARPFGGSCIAERCADFPELKQKLIDEFNGLGIEGLTLQDLNLLRGAYINLEYTLANGQKIKLLKDNDIYLGSQIERTGSERCYGVAADETFILVCEYGCNGADPEIVLYKRR